MTDINLGVGAANSATGGYDIDNSVKTEAANNEWFYRSSPTQGNRQTFTFSFWHKRTQITGYPADPYLMSQGSNARFHITGNTNPTLRFMFDGNSTELESSPRLRDTSAWYHIVLAVDTTQATASNRVKLYLNGEQISWDNSAYPSQNATSTWMSTTNMYFNTRDGDGSYDASGYYAEICVIDGQQLAPTDFGEFDSNSGIWKPIDVSGLTFGNEGFYLDFEDSSDLGADVSGNNNDCTLNNIAAADQATDTPTNNFCIINNNWKSSYTLNVSNGGTLISGGNGWSGYKGSMGVRTGKWYWEVELATGGGNSNMMVGVGDDGTGPSSFDDDNAHEIGYRHLLYYTAGGYRIWTNSSGGASNDAGVTLPTISEGDVIGIALNMDDSEISFYKNGSILLTYDGLDLGVLGNTDRYIGHVMPMVVNYSSLREPHVNFGGFTSSPPASGNSDANGYGNFEYAPPSGYYSLCSRNIGLYNSPTIDDSSAHYQGLAYRGDSSSTTSADRNLTNTGNSDLQPDWIWLFNRDTQLTGGQKIFDSNRGAGSGKSLSSSIPNAAGYNDALYGYVNAFNSDGFGVRAGTDSNRWYVDRGDGGGDRYVAFQWKANGGTTSSNTSGSITSTVQNNSDAGFSIVTFTGDGNNDATIGHGLGVKPEMIITKNVDESVSWRVWHKDLTANHMLFLNSNNVETDTNAHGNGYIKAVSTTTYTVYQGTTNTLGVNGSSDTMVAYCFASKQGFSMFGEYRGNGATDGEFVYTGFKPAFLLLKRRDASGYHWRLYSSAQNPTNELNRRMTPNLAELEGYHATDMSLDFYSNGFKFRTSNQINVNSGDYVFMAFAENPFATSTGIPTTAR